MNLRHTTFSLLSTAILVAPIATAHHSTSIYEMEKTLVIEGVVSKYEWRNPHVYIFVETRVVEGNRVIWKIEASPPALMMRRGWSRDTFSVGDRIVVWAIPARNPDRKMALGTAAERGNGQRLEMRDLTSLSSAGDSVSAKAQNLNGTWLTQLNPAVGVPFIIDPSPLPMTEKGAASVAEFQESMNPGRDCVSFTSPFLMIFPDVKSIEITPDKVIIRSQFEGVERIVHMDESSHDGADYSHHGHSIGRWEGNVLVVDTAKFSEHRMGNAAMLPSGARKQLTERFALGAGGEQLTYTFELIDPEYLQSKITGSVDWTFRPDMDVTPEECDLENARRYLRD